MPDPAISVASPPRHNTLDTADQFCCSGGVVACCASLATGLLCTIAGSAMVAAATIRASQNEAIVWAGIGVGLTGIALLGLPCVVAFLKNPSSNAHLTDPARQPVNPRAEIALPQFIPRWADVAHEVHAIARPINNPNPNVVVLVQNPQ